MEGRTVQVGTELTPFKMGIENYFDFCLWFCLAFAVCFSFWAYFLFDARKNKDKILILIIFLSFIPIYYIAFKSRAEDTARWLMPLVPVMAVSRVFIHEIHI
jgi:cell division protein FtsW (lipid II flippase)